MNPGEIESERFRFDFRTDVFFTMNVPFNALFRFRFIALATFFG